MDFILCQYFESIEEMEWAIEVCKVELPDEKSQKAKHDWKRPKMSIISKKSKIQIQISKIPKKCQKATKCQN